MERCSDKTARPPDERSIRAVLGGTREPVAFRSPALDPAHQRERVDDALRQGDLGVAEQAVDQWLVLAALDPDPQVWAEAVRAHAGVLALQGDLRAARRWADADASEAVELLFGRIAEPAGRAPSASDALALTRRAHRAVARRDRAAAADLRRRLAPFAGTLITRNGFGCDLPVSAHLARLALVGGDVNAAIERADEAVGFARRARSGPLLAWSSMLRSLALRARGDYAESAAARDVAIDAADAIGVRLPPDLPAGDPRPASLVRQGRVWRIDSPLGGGQVPALIGMGQLATLLECGAPVSAYDLAATPQPPAPIRPRLAEQMRLDLQARLPAAAARAEDWEVFAEDVRRVAGLTEAELPGSVLIPQSVGHNLRRAITAISAVAPSLGDHLAASVQTRAWCLYRPASTTVLAWSIAREVRHPDRASS